LREQCLGPVKSQSLSNANYLSAAGGIQLGIILITKICLRIQYKTAVVYIQNQIVNKK